MKVKHRIPAAAYVATEPLDDAYEREVQRSTEQGERAYRQAQERLERALQRQADAAARLAKDARNRRLQKAERRAAEEVERRRQELLELFAMMRSNPSASSKHRGRRGTPEPLPRPGAPL